jgi:Fe-S cluster assembly protein SufB
MATESENLESLVNRRYEHGFVTDIATESLPPGLDEGVVRAISARKKEPEWLLEWRLQAYRQWLEMEEPEWAHIHYPKINYDEISYYAAPKSDDDRPKSLDEVDPKLLETYDKLGIPLHERARLAGVAVDAVFDSVSVATTFKGKLADAGVIFCSFSEAVIEHPELVRKYLGTVVPRRDNYFAALNSAVFSDGSSAHLSSPTKAATSVTSKAAQRRCATKTSCTPQLSNSSPWTMLKSSIPRYRTGTRVMKTALAAYTTLSLNVATAVGPIQRYPGRR